MTPEREKEIRESIRVIDIHPKFNKFKDPSKQMIIELLAEVDALRAELSADNELINPIYKKFQEKAREQIKTVLKSEAQGEAVIKFLKGGDK